MSDIDLTEIDAAIASEDWSLVLAVMLAARDDAERHVAICAHAIKGAYALGARTGRDMALAKFMNTPRPDTIRNIAMDIVDALVLTVGLDASKFVRGQKESRDL